MKLLKPPAAPVLAPSDPTPTKRHLDSLFNTLRLYFVQLDSVLGSLLGRLGGRFLQFPQGSFSSRAVQVVPTINTPTLVLFDTVDASDGVYYVAGNGIHVQHSGLYNVQFSAQFTNGSVQLQDVAVWLRINGVDLPWSSSVMTVPETHGGQPGYAIMAANFYVQLYASDMLEFYWAASSTDAVLNALPPITTPFVNPGSPSIVATVTFVSNLE